MGRNLPVPNWEPDSNDLALWGGGLASGPPRGQPSIRLGRAAPAHQNWWVSGSWRKVGGQSKTHPERPLLTFRFVGEVKSGSRLRIQLRCCGLQRPVQAMLVRWEKEMRIALFPKFRPFSEVSRFCALASMLASRSGRRAAPGASAVPGREKNESFCCWIRAQRPGDCPGRSPAWHPVRQRHPRHR